MKRAWTAWWLSMFLLVSLAGFSYSQGASKEEVSEPPAPKRGILEVLLKIERNIWTAIQNKKLEDAFPYLDKTYTGFESEVQRRFDSPDEHYRYAVESLKDVTSTPGRSSTRRLRFTETRSSSRTSARTPAKKRINPTSTSGR